MYEILLNLRGNVSLLMKKCWILIKKWNRIKKSKTENGTIVCLGAQSFFGSEGLKLTLKHRRIWEQAFWQRMELLKEMNVETEL